MQVRMVRVLVFALTALLAGMSPVAAQITTGNISGVVHDAQGGVIPGATVVITSESRGTALAPVATNEAGVYVFPNVTPDVYTVEVTMDSFKTVRRTGIRVTGGDRVGVPTITLEPGAVSETVNVTAEASMVQSQSGERSFAIDTVQIENLPVNRGNFANLTAFVPGVVPPNNNNGVATRLGGQSQSNIMMDGVSAMDTGNNGQMLNMNIESIGEIKVLTQGYQAEYGRSSGLQITAVTKSGTNRFRGSGYSVFTDSDWNENSWVNTKNGDAKVKQEAKTYGYSIGGPVGRPGGNNKLFFFYAHEYRPNTTPINNGNPIRLRVPTVLERQGNFSQSVDNNGNPIPQLLNPTTRQPYPGNMIPAGDLYAPGVAVLNRYPTPNVEQRPGTNYNYEIAAPTIDNLVQQPAVRIDYQLSSKLRVTGKYSGQRERPVNRPGLLPGFSDVWRPYPYITNYAATVNYTLNQTTFIEGTYGFIRNELSDGNEGGILLNDASNRLTSLPGFPLLYPNAGVVSPNYYAHQVMQDVTPPFWDGTSLNLPPIFGWGSRIGNVNALPSPPNQRYPGWLNINRTQDVALSITKVMGRHTIKAGGYNNHSFKAQNVGAGGIANLSFQGFVDFGNNTNNALDTGFGFSNAATGVFTQYLQASDFIEGQMIYNNTEFYLQDNWKATNRLTMDYGIRFTRQQPQHDKFQQMSNFFVDQWALNQAPALYVAGCTGGAVNCSGNARNAMDPRTGQILTAPGTLNTQAAIGTPIPNSGNSLNGIRRAGDGIAETGYVWPTIVVGPRFGAAYDLTGTQDTIIRGGAGLFFDRPDGNTVFSIPGNPPIATAQDLRSGMLQTLGQGLVLQPVPTLITFQYDAKVPAQWQWNLGVQRALPWATSVDISYVGNRGYNRMSGLQGGNRVNLNAVDFGAAYLPQNQDRTQEQTAPRLPNGQIVPGSIAHPSSVLKPYRGYANIEQNTTEFSDTYHSMQFSLNRRFRNGFSFGANYTWGISFKGNTGLTWRLEHAADGTFRLRDDQAEYEELMETLDARPHYFRANGVWDLPNVTRLGRVVGHLLNDWQIAGVATLGSGSAYDVNFTYQNNGQNVNLTGSPDYGARIAYVGDPGSGCSDNQYAHINAAAVRGPTYGSVGLESGRNILRGCADKRVDLSLSRDVRIGGNRELVFRLDAFNVFNYAFITNRNNTIQYDNPISQNVLNAQYNADGSLNQTRLQPRNAGFGAATNAEAMRNLQLSVRFAF
jgi:hypothetical protein